MRTLVVGMSLDGKICPAKGQSSKILGQYASPAAAARVQALRAAHDAIMVSYRTVLSDDPRLTTRSAGASQCTRVVLDPHASVPTPAKVLDGSAPTILISSSLRDDVPSSVKVLVLPLSHGRFDLTEVFDALSQIGLDDVLIEGGGTMNRSLLENSLIDAVEAFIFPIIIGGQDTPSFCDGATALPEDLWSAFVLEEVMTFDQTVLCRYRRR